MIPKGHEPEGSMMSHPMMMMRLQLQIAFDVLCLSRKAGDMPREARAQRACMAYRRHG